MIRGLFPRVFSNFREAGIVHAKFVVSAGPVYTLKSAVSKTNFQGITAVAGTTGLITVTLTGGARSIAVLAAMHKSQDALAATVFNVSVYSIVEATGVVLLKLTLESSAALTNPANGDEIHITLLADK